MRLPQAFAAIVGGPLVVFCILSLAGCVAETEGEPSDPAFVDGDWSQWMGPHGNGGVDVGLLPRGVEVQLELEWSRPIGSGYSSLTISGNRILTLERDEGSVWVVGFDVVDGAESWRSPLPEPNTSGEENAGDPSSTPSTDGRRVFAIHPAGGLAAFDFEDGAVLWSRDLVADFGADPPAYGMSTSPVLAGDRLYVLVGGSEGNNFIAFDPATGETLLATGHARVGSYATPVIGNLGGVRQWVVPAGDRLYAMRSDSENVLWEYEGLTYPDRDPLLLEDDRVFLALQEYGAMLEVTGTPPQARELWRSERLSYSYSPAVFHEGAIYSYGAERLTCLDAASGRILWEQGVGDGLLIRVDDHLVAYETMSGQLSLVQASRDGYEEVATLAVFPSGGTVTPPSFAADRFFLRGRDQIVAVRLGF